MDVSGLKIATAINMFLNVFLNTPTACSSTKLAELSKPLIPNKAAEKAKKIEKMIEKEAGIK